MYLESVDDAVLNLLSQQGLGQILKRQKKSLIGFLCGLHGASKDTVYTGWEKF